MEVMYTAEEFNIDFVVVDKKDERIHLVIEIEGYATGPNEYEPTESTMKIKVPISGFMVKKLGKLCDDVLQQQQKRKIQRLMKEIRDLKTRQKERE